MRTLGYATAAALGAQVLFTGGSSLRTLIAAAVLAILCAQLWNLRPRLSEHVDMLLLMAGWGGLGMLYAPACHTSWSTFAQMNAGMLALGLPAAIVGSRCMRRARAEGRLLATIVVDTAAMGAAMLAAHALTGALHSPRVVAHIVMLFSMLSAMAAARWIETRRGAFMTHARS